MPHSLGLLYEAVTSYLGFLHSSDEYRVMALASYGQPRFVEAFRDVVHVGANGRYAVGPPRLVERFGPTRERGGPLERRHYDVARSLQEVLEETVLELASWLRRETRARDVCLAGGVALNCVNQVRVDRADRIPAVRHVDATARIQTIAREQHSLNTRGEPIVRTPRDAVEPFWTLPLDALVIGSFLLEK